VPPVPRNADFFVFQFRRQVFSRACPCPQLTVRLMSWRQEQLRQSDSDRCCDSDENDVWRQSRRRRWWWCWRRRFTGWQKRVVVFVSVVQSQPSTLWRPSSSPAGRWKDPHGGGRSAGRGGANAALPSPRRTAYSAVSNAVRLYSTSRILEFCLNFFRILQ